jgi:hypothetical protein
LENSKESYTGRGLEQGGESGIQLGRLLTAQTIESVVETYGKDPDIHQTKHHSFDDKDDHLPARPIISSVSLLNQDSASSLATAAPSSDFMMRSVQISRSYWCAASLLINIDFTYNEMERDDGLTSADFSLNIGVNSRIWAGPKPGFCQK